MKPETSERLFIEDLFRNSVENDKISIEDIVSIERLTGDASTRRYYRVFCKKCEYVVCLDNTSVEDNNFVKKQRYLNQRKIRVPNVYDTNPQKGYILEEDLGDVTFLQYLVDIESKDKEFELYKKVLDELFLFHQINKEDLKKTKLFDEAFDFTKLNDELDFSLKYFFRLFLKVEDEQVYKTLSSEFKEICTRLSSKEMVLTHRDFHSRNIMVKEEELIIIDFQDARMGIPQYDLASVLDDCYYEIDPLNKDKLLQYYFENLQAFVSDQEDYQDFLKLYDDMVIQRVFKAIGSFSYIYEHRKDERYLKYIGFAMEKLKAVLLKDEKYSALRKTLFKAYYES